jgi:hypothetical protein
MRGRGMVVLFVVTSFLTASLLFLVQPMVGRMVLPAFGGSPQVWTTSMLFFQVALLVGYGYTHLTTTRLSPRIQPWVHLSVAAVPVATLPIALTVAPSGAGGIAPSLELLAGLTFAVAAPFVLIATSGPLVQRWFSWSSHPSANDPYFLYAAGNVGSAAGLLAYPFLLEPLLTIEGQSRLWAGGYLLAVGLLAACATVVLRQRSDGSAAKSDPQRSPTPRSERIGAIHRRPVARRQAARWVLLAFIPSSLMLAVTTLMSTDIAAVPLLWIAPLGTYLLTFTLAFSRLGPGALRWARFGTPLVVVAAVTVRPAGTSVAIALGVQVLLVLVGGTLAHGLLAAERPDPAYLTRFYLLVAVGGALGGLFNGLVAPLLFPTVLEYGITLVLVIGLVVRWREPVVAAEDWPPRRRLPTLAVLGLLPAASLWIFGFDAFGFPAWLRAAIAVPFILPFLTRVRSSGVVGVSVAVISLLPALGPLVLSDTVVRTFFGVHQVRTEGDVRLLLHGTTLHGSQDLSSASRRMIPLSYYHPDEPLGDVFATTPAAESVGVVGLGSGSIAAYGQQGQSITFHELDPAVVDIARTSFSFLDDTVADVVMVLGDGRLTLEGRQDSYDILVVDAFTSDAIPVHLLTLEALALYLDTTTENGVVAINISNRYLDLLPVLAAATAELGASGRFTDGDGEAPGSAPSRWAVIAKDGSTVTPLEKRGWEQFPDLHVPWTDQRSALWPIVRR